ncbi:MAG: hypothetical protein P4L41_05440 [Flavipsychrobacter sp.]|nr:hypothetical protein [Flavipsychrobacter sp.]
MNKITQQQQAKELYFGTGRTQKEIAQAVGVDGKTIYRWIKQEAWDELKKATLAVPAVAVNHLYSQMVELQNHIASREEGNRFPTIQEAEITRKLINCIDKLGTANSLSTNIQVMMAFSNYMVNADNEFTKKLVSYASTYFKDQKKSGYKPYEFLYDAHLPEADTSVIAPIKEELDQDEENRPGAPAKKLITWRELSTNPAPILKSGPMWIGPNTVFDYKQKTSRNMTWDEAEELRKMGFDVEWEKNNPGSAQTAPMPGSVFHQVSGIQSTAPAETIAQQASPAMQLQNSPCPPPGITGHCTGSNEGYDIPEELKKCYPNIPLLPGGVKWLGRDMVYDPKLKRKREIKFGERDQLGKWASIGENWSNTNGISI